MKNQKGSFCKSVFAKLIDYLKEIVAPETLESVRLNLFGGSTRDYMRFLKSQRTKK